MIYSQTIEPILFVGQGILHYEYDRGAWTLQFLSKWKLVIMECVGTNRVIQLRQRNVCEVLGDSGNKLVLNAKHGLCYILLCKIVLQQETWTFLKNHIRKMHCYNMHSL